MKVMQINKREGVICKVEGGEVFLLTNHGLPWRWVRWRYFGGVLEKLWRSLLEKLGET